MGMLSLGCWTMAGWLARQESEWRGWLRLTHHPLPLQLRLAGNKHSAGFAKLFFEAYPFADCSEAQLRELVRLSLLARPKFAPVHDGQLVKLDLGTADVEANGSLVLRYVTEDSDVTIELPRIRLVLEPEGTIDFTRWSKGRVMT